MTILIAALALLGWALGVRTLTSVIPGAVMMKVNTAVLLVCGGLSLLILSGNAARPLVNLARFLSIAVALLGAATLIEYVSGRSLGIDELIARDDVRLFNPFRGRMSPLSAVAFVAIGFSLSVIRHPGLKAAAAAGGWLAVSIAGLASLGYLWAARELVTDSWLPPVALNTACCFLLLGLGILSVQSAAQARNPLPGALFSVAKKTFIGFAVGFLSLVAGGGLTYRAAVDFAHASAWVEHSQEVRATLAAVYGSLAGAELAERNYLLTADAAHLDEFRALEDDLGTRTERLERLTLDDPVQQRNAAELRALVTARLAHVADTLEIYRRSGAEPARAALARQLDPQLVGNIRAVTDRMDALERGYLAKRQEAAARVRATTLVLLLLTLAIAGLVFLLLFGAIQREMRARQLSQDGLLEANRFLDSLIENLPVTVALKDARTLRLVRLNRAFEQSTGLRREAALGKTAHDLWSTEEAQRADASDRQALAGTTLLELPDQEVQTAEFGVKVYHTVKMPVAGRDGTPQYLLAISLDVTQRKLSEQALHELNAALQGKAAQLEASNRELESFSYSVSHDLRAPLRAIDAFALMLEEDYGGQLDAEGRRFLAVIRQSADRMGHLIDDLLALSRLGRRSLVSQDVDMGGLARDVANEVLELHEGTKPAVLIGELPSACGDPALLRQVWTNLISNAAKYSGKCAQPRIEIRGTREADRLCYTVRDNGVGFDMAYVDKLFGAFQRLHRQDEFGGTGVGLAIVRRIIRKHGGEVWAEAAVGQGATFSFTLPREPHAAESAARH